jgi:hypothetical protein
LISLHPGDTIIQPVDAVFQPVQWADEKGVKPHAVDNLIRFISSPTVHSNRPLAD